MSILVPVLVAGGGVAYVLSEQHPSAIPPDAQTYNGGNQLTNTIAVPVPTAVGNGGKTAIGGGHLGRPYSAQGIALNFTVGPTSANQSNNVDPALQQKLDAITAAAQDQYNKLSADAKAAGADAANQALNINPPLTGQEDWATMSSIVGGAAGGAAGAYIGGPVGAKIGAIVGAYLGTKLEDLISQNAADLGNWLQDKWGWTQDQATGIWNDVSSTASSVWDDATSWI